MKKNIKISFLFLIFSLVIAPVKSEVRDVDVLIIGGGASGSMAGIQSSRMGAETLIVEEGPWLGGMLTSAGVSAIDGNYRLYSGLWEEFRQNLYDYYGGAEGVLTGWVSNVLFEPSVGAEIIASMADEEELLEVLFNTKYESVTQIENGWKVDILVDGYSSETVFAKRIIDATELGDVSAKVGINYDIGMDSRHDTGEYIAPEEANDIIQDLTYVVILKDYGEDADMTIEKPENYDPAPFICSCEGICDQDTISRTLWECDHMINYGRLPNDRYMINWPIFGNDYYLNVIENSPEERLEYYEKAKWFTRCFIYYMQTELGFSNLGIADDEFPTDDNFPLIPYHRESRRIEGIVRFTMNDLAEPFNQPKALYRTGIAVGDYPVDHHHDAANKDQNLIPELYFYPIPSYSVPLGSLIPKNVDDFIVAEKSISVSNVVNGTSRLQPVCILLGHAAGSLAALSVSEGVTPSQVNIRDVQQSLLDSDAYIMPFSEITPCDSYFKSVQRIGATGIIRGEGKNIGWENFTFFYPDSVMISDDLIEGLKYFNVLPDDYFNSSQVTGYEIIEIAEMLLKSGGIKGFDFDPVERAENLWTIHNFGDFDPDNPVTRSQAAVILDLFADPFYLFPVNHQGHFY
ncbi:FAD-dependent oxidoreductase [Marinilabiliaceae bacterium ANBcel2]|nr:FAD-dependent oxidoreductase [Marinilabiliaceae bacterium ANBcel2]